MKDLIKKILKEERETYEYQVRYIDVPVFYKRKKGTDIWGFVTGEEFADNAHKIDIVKWDKKEEK